MDTHYIVVVRDRLSGRTMQTVETFGFKALCDVLAEWDERYAHAITLTVRHATRSEQATR